MAIAKLSKKQIDDYLARGQINPEYLAFLSSSRVGYGGRVVVAKEGASRQTIKRRLLAAAEAAGVTIRFRRSSPEDVVFEVMAKK